jgi:hypothetical protein
MNAMADAPWPPSGVPGYMTEDLPFKSAGGITEHGHKPTSPVNVSVVKRHGAVMGYLWADDSADAAGYLPSYDAGAVAVNVATDWILRLREAKARRLTPSQALGEFAAEGPTESGKLLCW